MAGSQAAAATIWQNGTATTLPNPQGVTATEASALNDDGTDIAGVGQDTAGTTVAIRWTCG